MVNVDWLRVWICCIIEQIGSYLGVEWFLDVHMFGMSNSLINIRALTNSGKHKIKNKIKHLEEENEKCHKSQLLEADNIRP